MSFADDFVAGEILDTQEIEFGLELWKLVVEGLEAFFEWLVGSAETLGADLVGHVELVDLLHLGMDAVALGLKRSEHLSFLDNLGVSLFKVIGQLI
ncbi:MAG: hypothetical protein HY048_15230 [Acidobacteria bacterium]|nr:hypothetical protein [Acidobacteriota bacterium]